MDVGGWDKVKLVVIEMATEQQAMGNQSFRDRLVGGEGSARGGRDRGLGNKT